MNTGPEQRRLAAIMFTDMAGYSALAQRSEALALELLEEHRRLVRALLPRFNGTEVKTIGDAFLIKFQSALTATQCAVEIQRTLAKRNADALPERRIEVKIGIHIGDVVHRGGDVYGDGVNIASRIEPLAGPGGICVSVDVERQTRSAVEVSLVKLAPKELKNIQSPMELFRVILPWEHAPAPATVRTEAQGSSGLTFRPTALAFAAAVVLVFAVGGGIWLKRARAPSSPKSPGHITSLAVKPLDDFSGDTNQAYLSDGMTEALCAALARLSQMRHGNMRFSRKIAADTRPVGHTSGVWSL